MHLIALNEFYERTCLTLQNQVMVEYIMRQKWSWLDPIYDRHITGSVQSLKAPIENFRCRLF